MYVWMSGAPQYELDNAFNTRCVCVVRQEEVRDGLQDSSAFGRWTDHMQVGSHAGVLPVGGVVHSSSGFPVRVTVSLNPCINPKPLFK